MTNGESTGFLMKEIDNFLSESEEKTRIDQRMALRLVLASTRAVLQQVTTDRARTDKISEKIDIMFPAYRIMVWIGGILGVSVIALLWSLATGTAAIVIK